MRSKTPLEPSSSENTSCASAGIEWDTVTVSKPVSMSTIAAPFSSVVATSSSPLRTFAPETGAPVSSTARTRTFTLISLRDRRLRLVVDAALLPRFEPRLPILHRQKHFLVLLIENDPSACGV